MSCCFVDSFYLGGLRMTNSLHNERHFNLVTHHCWSSANSLGHYGFEVRSVRCFIGNSFLWFVMYEVSPSVSGLPYPETFIVLVFLLLSKFSLSEVRFSDFFFRCSFLLLLNFARLTRVMLIKQYGTLLRYFILEFMEENFKVVLCYLFDKPWTLHCFFLSQLANFFLTSC